MRRSSPVVLSAPFVLAVLAGCARTPPASDKPSGTTNTVPLPAASATVSAQGAMLASASVAAPTAPPPPAAPPSDANVILISIDSLRADMPWSGYPRPIAPRLTELEKKAVSYTHAYSVSSYTSMSLGGLLGAKLPSELQRDGYFFGTYNKDNRFFPELLQAAKVHTMAAQAHFYFKSGSGFEQGFDEWEIVPGIKSDNTTDQNITSPQSEQIAERLLGNAANNSRRFFFWAHFLDPHDQYMPHDGVGPYGKTDRDKYDAEVTYTDQYVGKLLDFIATKPWAGKTAIILTSDHGEAFGEHGRTRHGFEIWEPLVRVPLMLVLPGAPARHIDRPRSALDVSQTIMELLGVAPDASYEGKSLVKEAYGADAEVRDVYVDLPATSDNDKRRALIRGNFKLTCYTNDNICKLFDLNDDPTEDKPIGSGDKFDELHAAYLAHVKTMHEVEPYNCHPGTCLNGAYHNRH